LQIVTRLCVYLLEQRRRMTKIATRREIYDSDHTAITSRLLVRSNLKANLNKLSHKNHLLKAQIDLGPKQGDAPITWKVIIRRSLM
jgi:hypothetical protein